MHAVDVITLIIAMIGAVLGVLSTYRDFSRDRVRLRVVPKLSLAVSGDNVITGDRPTALMRQLMAQGCPIRLCIEVINLSPFSVTISDVGFGRIEGKRHAIFQPQTGPGHSWPARLESRQAVTLFCAPETVLNPDIVRDAVAYATTDCDETRYGTSAIFREYVRQMKFAKRS